MENKMSLIVFFTLFLSCCVFAPSSATKRTGSLFGTMFMKSRDVDRSEFNADQLFQDANSRVSPLKGQKENDRISTLPGQPTGSMINQYSGYVNVNEKNGRELFYYFVVSEQPSAKTSLILWLNGGPGCSSVGYGAFEGNGPFRVLSDGKTLIPNPYSWNKAANMLYLESPAGVGFSYSNTTADIMQSSDATTASDNLLFLLNWLIRFPEYKGAKLFLASESYASHYVSGLAQAIIKYNQMNTTNIINLQGILMGNPALDDYIDSKGMYQFWGSHAIVSNETVNQLLEFCGNLANPMPDPNCKAAMDKADDEAGDINVYNIYAQTCNNHNLTRRPKITSVLNVDACSDDYVKAYLNRPDVQKALHVANGPIQWNFCSDDVGSNWTGSPTTILPILKYLFTQNLTIWIVSGDIDARLPVTSTLLSIEEMELPVTNTWNAWSINGEVCGYVTVYQYLTFMTIKGSGLTASLYKPVQALSVVKHFLDRTSPTNSTIT